MHKVQWPSVFAGLQGMTWVNFPREISAGITLAALIIPLNIGYAQAMNDIDTTGAETLHQVLQWLKGRGVSVSVSRANPSATALLGRYRLMELIGENRLYPTNRHALAAFRRETAKRRRQWLDRLKT